MKEKQIMVFILIGLLALLAVFFIVLMRMLLYRMRREYNSFSGAKGTTGIDIDTGHAVYPELQGHHGFDDRTGMLKKGAGCVTVYLENCATRDSYSAEMMGDVVIGRMVMGHPEYNTIPISDALSISRRHCRLQLVNGEIVLENLSRHSVTRLNGKIIRGVKKVQIGDYIGIGDVQLRIAGIRKAGR